MSTGVLEYSDDSGTGMLVLWARFLHVLKRIQYYLETPQKRPHVDVMSEAAVVDMTQGDCQSVQVLF